MWAQALVALAGIWIMAAPAVIGFDGAAATNAYIVGPLIAAFGVIAMAQATRNVRRVNLVLAAWLLAAPLLLDHSFAAAFNSTATGVAVALLSLIRGRITHRFGGGWSVLWRPARARPRVAHQ